jgi:4-alpha-glucanotransferase
MVAQTRHSCCADGLLAELATLWGVQTGYRDAAGSWRESSRGAVLQVLEALGAGADDGLPARADGELWHGPQDERRLQHAIDAKKADVRDRLIEPVLVAWEGLPPPVGTFTADSSAQLTLLLEEGGEERWEVGRDRPMAGSAGRRSGGWRQGRLPFGYHRLRLEVGGRVAEATVISAPRRCWTPAGDGPRAWGVFAPAYALRSERDWGAGDLADLGGLCDLVGGAGGRAVATLPLLAAFLDRPFEPAPYNPVSRLFWNEFFLAVDQVAEWGSCDAARDDWNSGEIRGLLAGLRATSLVDYAGVMALKRRVLKGLSRCFFDRADPKRKEAFASYLRTHPEARNYAAFRGRVEAMGADWRDWPRGERVVILESMEPVGLSEAERYHLYCQWQMEEQLSRFSHRCPAVPAGGRDHARPGSAGLFLDLPVGVHPGGFDTWRWRESFVTGMHVGAPPDSFFTRGQDWDSPPLHPLRIREQGHRYFVGCLRQHMRHGRYVRIDHVMSLHRLFWIPEGRAPAEGVYVSYPADELYAALCLESHRHQTEVVGEDLGTVPPGVRASMRSHGVLGTWMLQSSLRSRAARVVSPVPRHVVAGFGTHDMFPFVGFLRCDDIVARTETGQLDRADARRAGAARRRLVAKLAAFLGEDADAPAALLRAALTYLGASPAAFVLVNLEDLLLETRPQNLPGTGAEQGNWRRKAATSGADVGRAIEEAAGGLSVGRPR